MFENIIYSNDFFNIIIERSHVFINVSKPNFDMNAFNDLLKEMPRVKIEDFKALKTALAEARQSFVKFGAVKPLVEVQISNDHLLAYAHININKSGFQEADKKKLLESILKASNEMKIIYGQDLNEVINNMKPMEQFVIARGKEPIRGKDAVITMFELKENKPELYQDGKVNHYELNLINTVLKDDWLGERIEPTAGIEGISVLGNKIPPMDGRQEALKFDPNTVRSTYDDEKKMTYLHAKRSGAVVYLKERISVCNYLDIDGDVSFHTGNIDFDGFVEIKNTVDDNFSVTADNDIQVMGSMGIGGVDLIESRGGNIYIRGGIAGKNKAVIRCNGDLYTKFAADCTIECSGTLNIGYYAMNCHIKAKEVILEASNSQIIGGVTEAKARVLVSELGSRAGVFTKVVVTGFDREKVKADYDVLDSIIEDVRKKMNRAKNELDQYSISLDEKTRLQLQEKEAEYENHKSKIEELLKRKSTYTSFLRAKGSGEVIINKKLFQNVSIGIVDDKYISTDEEHLPCKFHYRDYEIHKE